MRDEREARARYLLGRLLADIHEDECAAELLRAAISYMPGMAEAHVKLGFVYCRLEMYEEAVGSLREAVRLDEQSVRAAVRDDPAELEAIRRVLYPERQTSAPGDEARAAKVPAYVRQAWALVDLAREHIGAGRDDEAVAALEAVLRLDETYLYAITLLSLAYLLIREHGGAVPKEGEGSILWEVEPAWAELLFKGWDSTTSVSH